MALNTNGYVFSVLAKNAKHGYSRACEWMPKVKYRIPEATYLGWLDFRAYGMTDQELWDFMCHKAEVATDDGPKFGPNGEAGSFQRINFSCPRAQLEEALNRIADALDAL